VNLLLHPAGFTEWPRGAAVTAIHTASSTECEASQLGLTVADAVRCTACYLTESAY